MSELTEFLLARIAEDEAVAQMRQARGDGERDSAMAASYGRTHFVADPTTSARVLAECDAKRRIVEVVVAGARYRCGQDHASDLAATLQLLALVYADHPDYDESWRP